MFVLCCIIAVLRNKPWTQLSWTPVLIWIHLHFSYTGRRTKLRANCKGLNSRRILALMKSAAVGAFRHCKPETADGPGKPCVPPAPTRDWKPCHSLSHSPFFSHFPEEPWWFPAGNKSADLFPHIPHWSRTTGPAASSQCRRAGFISVITCKHSCCLPEGPRTHWSAV